MAFHINRCPDCGNEIQLPAFMKNSKMNIQGTIKIRCGYFNPRRRKQCKGVLEIKPKTKIEVKEDSIQETNI